MPLPPPSPKDWLTASLRDVVTAARELCPWATVTMRESGIYRAIDVKVPGCSTLIFHVRVTPFLPEGPIHPFDPPACLDNNPGAAEAKTIVGALLTGWILAVNGPWRLKLPTDNTDNTEATP